MSAAPVPGGISPGGRTVVIVGAGFSGTMVASNLLRSATGTLRIVLAEKTGAFARGTAYSTGRETHRLNVAAGRMGAFPDREGHFLEFLRRTEPGIATGAFVPRRRYGEYLGSVLEEAQRGAAAGVTLERRADEAIALTPMPGGATVQFKTTEPVAARHVVLAIGNPPPAEPFPVDPSLARDERYVADPWRPGREVAADDRPVLLIGTGLTMFDVALDLVERGHTGPMIAVSRRGMVPTSHRSPSLPPAHLDPWNELAAWDGSALSLLRLVRGRIKQHPEGEWREVINSLRPVTQQIWKSMNTGQRRRFLDRVRPYWESARHRAPDDVGAAIRGLMDAGRLGVRAARLLSITASGNDLEVRLRARGRGAGESLRVARVVNCTGPRCDYSLLDEPLVSDLLARGLIVPDALRLGLETADDGALLDLRGKPSEVLFTLGPPRRPALWETTAVPELRAQAQKLAARLLAA